MQSHQHFMGSLLGAPQDVSRPVFEELIGEGYNEGAWETNPSATDGPCVAMNGTRLSLQDLISNLQHDAPIFEKTHPGCHCGVRCTGEGKPDVVVGAFGRV